MWRLHSILIFLLSICSAVIYAKVSSSLSSSSRSQKGSGLGLSAAFANDTVIVMPMAEFALTGKISLHFPCKESNMFATNCACHQKCIGDCKNAVALCKKYEKR
jgi:hypothetical protein